MIKETETSHPLICQRGLKSLLDVLQGLLPEDLRDEPDTVMEAMFTSLLDLASRPGNPISINGNVEEGAEAHLSNKRFSIFISGGHIRALACSCLLSLAVASGSTAHLLRTTAAMLMSPRSDAGELVVMPGINISTNFCTVPIYYVISRYSGQSTAQCAQSAHQARHPPRLHVSRGPRHLPRRQLPPGGQGGEQ